MRFVLGNTENIQAGQFVIVIEGNNLAVLELDVLYGLGFMTIKDGVEKVDGDLLPFICLLASLAELTGQGAQQLARGPFGSIVLENCHSVVYNGYGIIVRTNRSI